MKTTQLTQLTQCSILAGAKQTRKIPYEKITAGLAVMAWLALAGQAFSQTTNQWALAPVIQTPSAPAHVWADGEGAAIYAPADLDQQLSAGVTRPAATPTSNLGFGQAAPVYAPASPSYPPTYPPTYPVAQIPTQPVAPPQGQAVAPGAGWAPQSFNPQPLGGFMPPQGYGQGYGQPYPNMPYSGGYGMPTFAPTNGGYGSGPYNSGPYNNGPYNNGPYSSGPTNWGNNWGNNWGGPSTNNSFGGLPFFGGSPFSFW